MCLVFENTLPKVSFTTAVTAIGVWGYTPVRTTGVLVCYPHMPIGMLGIYRLLFVCVCPQDFCKGYLRPGLTEGDEIR